MEQLHDKYQAQGLEILAFPSGQFMGQEAKTDAEIKTFVTETVVSKGISSKPLAFTFFAKSDVNGPNVNPVFRFLKEQPGCDGAIAWNFKGKFLVSRDGMTVQRTSDKASTLHARIEELLKVPAPE
mmetsp:Transcript_15526/g.30645  ORF Transcript_15526/g.30645 Transcript_15526/m.30645 type:complete len:126 (+) Transcript_15526:267-644(+)